jgi:hypothetical protein
MGLHNPHAAAPETIIATGTQVTEKHFAEQIEVGNQASDMLSR